MPKLFSFDIGRASIGWAVFEIASATSPQLEGCDPPAMQRIIRGKVDEIMGMLSESTAKIWENDATD